MNYFFLRIFSFWRILPTLTFVVFVSPLVIVLLSLTGDYSDNWTHLYNFVLGDYITNSIFLVLGVGLISLIIGTSSAWIITKYDFFGRTFNKNETTFIKLTHPSNREGGVEKTYEDLYYWIEENNDGYKYWKGFIQKNRKNF